METEKEGPRIRWDNRTLWRLVWPLVLELLLSVAIGMADTVMVTTAGEAAVSGISLVDAINMLLITLFTSMATGGAVVISQYLGRRDPAAASKAAGQLITTCFAIAMAMMGVALLFGKPILSLIYGHIDADVMANAQLYFILSAASYPFFGIYNAGAAIFRSMGNSKVGLFISILMNLINIGGNAILIFGFGWGVAGAGTASLLSRIASAVAILWLLNRAKQGPVQVRSIKELIPDFTVIKKILNIGVPNGLENSMFQVGKLLTARIISTFGTAAIAANAIAGNVANVGYVLGQAIGLALLTVVGQCVGAADFEGAKQYHRKLVLLCHASLFVMGGLFLLFGRNVLMIFNLSDEARNIAYQCCLVNFLAAFIIWPESFSVPNSLRAAGDVKYTMGVSLFSMWAFRIGFSFLFAYSFGWGVVGVWAAMTVDWLVRAIFFLLRWRSGKWEAKRLLS